MERYVESTPGGPTHMPIHTTNLFTYMGERSKPFFDLLAALPVTNEREAVFTRLLEAFEKGPFVVNDSSTVIAASTCGQYTGQT